METRACEVRVVHESVLTREFLGSGSSKVPLIKFYTVFRSIFENGLILCTFI